METRAKVKQILESGKSGKEIGPIVGISRTSAYQHIRPLIKEDQVDKGKINYVSQADLNDKWYNIIDRTNKELAFYEGQDIAITARTMGYRLIELTQLERKNNPNISAPELWALGLLDVPDINDPKYEEAKGSFFNGFYSKSDQTQSPYTTHQAAFFSHTHVATILLTYQKSIQRHLKPHQ